VVWANVFPAFFDMTISPRWFFFVGKFVFFQEFATNTGGIVDVYDTLTSEFMFIWMCVRWVGCGGNDPLTGTDSNRWSDSPVPSLTGEVVHRYVPLVDRYRITGRDHIPVGWLVH
jgi:hypothetical protein